MVSHLQYSDAASEAGSLMRQREYGRGPALNLRHTPVAVLTAILLADSSFAECTPSTPCASPPTNLGQLGNGGAVAQATNSDGTVVVGVSDRRAFRWTVIDGMQDPGTLGGADALARGVSADGSVVVGTSSLKTSSNNPPEHAFRWASTQKALQDLGVLKAGDWSNAFGVSSDGLVIVGESKAMPGATASLRAFRWTSADGMQDLGNLGGGFSTATATNSDGSVVVGGSLVSGKVHAFRWAAATGMRDLGTLPGGTNSSASGTNSDGSVVVGQSETGGGTVHAFRWTSAEGMQDLGTTGGAISAAAGTNGDGSVVVGCSSISSATTSVDLYSMAVGGCNYVAGASYRVLTSMGPRAFRWTAETGMRDLNTLISEAGITTGLKTTMVVAYGVSLSFQPLERRTTAFRVCVVTGGPADCSLWSWPFLPIVTEVNAH
jgi:probable HAF family extracellular repeat protein